jgi:hypothetical protein
MIQISYIKRIIDELKARGFRHRSWRNGILGTAIYIAHNNKTKVVVKSIEIPFSSTKRIADLVDEYFKKLQSLLKGIIASYGNIQIFLPGGGSIPIPEWFVNWCRENGVKIEVCDSDFLPEID